ncbi:MAG TPA: hypothetical protein VF491_09770 [Vicinamibacterales bacterium]
MSGQRGVALVMVVLLTTFLSALGLGLLLAVFMDRLATGNLTGSVAMLYAADAGIEMAAHDLALSGDWDAVLSAGERSSFTDGAPAGSRPLPGDGMLDLTAVTNNLNCGKASACTVAQMDADSLARPWGANNPRWRLYAYGPMARLNQLFRPAPCYLVVWIADDGREDDGDPLTDAKEGAGPGHGIVRVRAEVFGRAGSRRGIEAELERVCLPASAGCGAGIRVQSWQELR